MSDPAIKAALEEAAAAVCEERNQPYWPCGGRDYDEALAAAAVAKFLRDLDLEMRHKLATACMSVDDLAAGVEEAARDG